MVHYSHPYHQFDVRKIPSHLRVLEVFYYLQELDCDVKKQAALSLSLLNKCVDWPEVSLCINGRK